MSSEYTFGQWLADLRRLQELNKARDFLAGLDACEAAELLSSNDVPADPGLADPDRSQEFTEAIKDLAALPDDEAAKAVEHLQNEFGACNTLYDPDERKRLWARELTDHGARRLRLLAEGDGVPPHGPERLAQLLAWAGRVRSKLLGRLATLPKPTDPGPFPPISTTAGHVDALTTWRVADLLSGAEVGQDTGQERRKTGPRADGEETGMTWQEVAKRLQTLYSRGESFTSQAKLAEALRCAPGTVNKAIRNTPELHGWAKRAAQPRATSANVVVMDNRRQSTELDPADDAAIREYIETADPEVRAWFLALPIDAQLDHLDDPDRHQKILGRKP